MARKLALVAVLLMLALGASSVSAIRPPVQVWICSCSYCWGVTPNTPCSLIGGDITTCWLYFAQYC